MKKPFLAHKILLGSLAFSLSCTAIPYHAFAADTGFISQIAEKYNSFELKHQTEYKAYLQHEKNEYQMYLNQISSVYKELHQLAQQDFDNMAKTLNNDALQLKTKYNESSQSYKAYIRAMDKDSSGTALDLYEDTMDQDQASSAMDLFQDAIDFDQAGSAMDLFEDAIDPDTAGSAMDLYEDEVDPDTAGSAMDLFEDDSDINSAGSIMDLYEDGNITKEEAQKRMEAATVKAETAINERIAATKKSIQQTKNNSLKKIRDTRVATIRSILEQREKSIAAISEARTQLTGEGITFEPLTVNPWITVVLNGDFQIFEQPPVIVNGNTLVPLRAIFEKLGAEVLWNGDDQSVTARKGTTSIWLQIDNATAKIDGKDQSLEVAPQIINGNTMVPLRFVSEALGADVQWDGPTSTATITLK